MVRTSLLLVFLSLSLPASALERTDRNRTITLGDAMKANPQSLLQMMFDLLARDAEIVDSGISSGPLSLGSSVGVTLRKQPKATMGTGICTVEEISIESYSHHPNLPGNVLDTPKVRVVTRYKIVAEATDDSSIAAMEPTEAACNRLDRKDLFFSTTDDPRGNVAYSGARHFQEVQKRLKSGDLAPFHGEGCPDLSACAAVVRNLDARLIQEMERRDCDVEGGMPEGWPCAVYQITFTDKVSPNGHSGSNHVIDVRVDERDSMIKEIRYRLSSWVV